MGLRSNLDEMSKDALEFLRRSMDGCKLRLVENLSLLMGGLVCGFVLFQLLLVACLLLLAVLVFSMIPFVGVPLALLAAALLLMFAAFLLFVFRERIFVDGFVRLFAKMIFGKEDEDAGAGK